MTAVRPLSRARLAIVGVVTLLAAWFVATSTVGSVFARSRPAIALSASPRNAEANANHARRLFQEEPLRPDWPTIVAAARASLSRSPGNVAALAMLGAHADVRGQRGLAERVFRRSAALSRHDQITQIYLIEDNVARGDVSGALAHYDAALSTSRSSGDILLPTLVAASADPAVARPLAALLTARPVWWEEFARQLVNARAAPGAGFPILVTALRLDPSDDRERGLLSVALSRLADTGQAGLAYGLYRRATGAPGVPAAVRNGGFEAENRLPPFEWSIRDGNGASGYVQPLDGSNALFVQTEGVDAEVAVQRLLLTPGRYRLVARMASEDGSGGGVRLVIRCAAREGAGTTLATLRAPAGAPARSYRADVVVPATGCAGQHLGVVASATGASGGAAWVDAIAIDRAR